MQSATGAFVISLDFELHWGIREFYPADGAYRRNLLGARKVIPRLLELFAEYDIAATWATVGFLFARSREELEHFSPQLKPRYVREAVNAYREPVGRDEEDDPLHFAPSLIEAIHHSPRQEVASHTFSHYYCLEPGQTREAFRADLESAVAIAKARGVALRSIVFPQNQLNPAYSDLLHGAGLYCFRGNEKSALYKGQPRSDEPLSKRLGRMADSYVKLTGDNLAGWAELREADGLVNVPSSRFLRPYSPRRRALEPLRLKRIEGGIRVAAQRGKIFHLWWHPHNFGVHQGENLGFLERVLETFCRYRQSHGIRSVTMAEVADAALSRRDQTIQAPEVVG